MNSHRNIIMKIILINQFVNDYCYYYYFWNFIKLTNIFIVNSMLLTTSIICTDEYYIFFIVTFLQKQRENLVVYSLIYILK